MASKTAGIDTEVVRELAAILRDTDLTEIEVEVQNGEFKLRIARQAAQIVTAQTAAPSYAQALSAAPLAAPAVAAISAPPSDRTNPGMVPSPIVGTVYLAPEPGAPTFVSLGDSVAEGQTILIVEAMKTMNPIAAPRAGKVIKICVSDTQPVEYGEPLIILE